MTAHYARFAELHPAGTATAERNRPVLMIHGGNVAGWMWESQVAILRDRTVLTPDMPGFGKNGGQGWPGLDVVTDRLAAGIVGLAEGPADVVGMSLGGVVGLHLAARHPDLVASAFVTGASVLPYTVPMRFANAVQLGVWGRPGYWRLVARAFGLSGQDVVEFVAQGLAIRRATMLAITSELYPGIAQEVLGRIRSPMLAVAGSRESRYFHRSLRSLRAVLPDAEVRLVPGVHHAWSNENEALFNDVLHAWLGGRVHHSLRALTS